MTIFIIRKVTFLIVTEGHTIFGYFCIINILIFLFVVSYFFNAP